MSDQVECIVVGNVDFDVKERMVASDSISQNCCKRQYIKYNGRSLYYNEMLSLVDEHQSFNVNEIPSFWGMLVVNYLSDKGISTDYINCISNLDEAGRIIEIAKPLSVVINIGTINNSLPIVRVVRLVKKYSPETKILLNGLYIYNKWMTSNRDEFIKMMDLIGADNYVISMPGVELIYETVLKIINQEENETVIYKKNCKEGNQHDIWNYLSSKYIKNIMYIKTTRGCPAKCSFCNFPIKNSDYALEDIDILEKQLLEYEKNNVEYLLFADDTLNVPVERFKRILNMMINNKFSFKWFAYCRLNELNEDIISLMKKSGCMGVYVGIESANDQILKNMNKCGNKNKFKKIINLLAKYNIMIFAFFLVGFPGETSETVQETISFINNNPITFYTANLWYADVSTPIYESRGKYQLSGKDFNWAHNTMNSMEASKYADSFVLNIDNAIWIPNENFGFQGVAYLLSKGYTIEKIKKILKLLSKLVINNLTEKKNDPDDIINQIKTVIRN